MDPISDAKEFFEVAMTPVLQACSRSDAPRAVAAAPTSIEAVHAAADSLHVEVSKVAIFLGGSGSKPSESEARSVLEAAQQRFAAICALLYARVAGAAGPSLRSATGAAGRALLQACQAFLDSLNRPTETEQVPQKVGIIRERCTAIMRAPKDNRAAIGAQLTKIARQVKDALREAHELAQPAASPAGDTAAANGGQQANGHDEQQASSTTDQQNAAAHHSSSHMNGTATAAANESGHNSSDVADMMMYEGEELTASELAIAQAAEQVVRQVLDMLLALIRALSKMPEPAGPELETWESLVFHCKTLETSTNDLVADLFGPQDPESVASAAKAVMTGSELILEELPAGFPETHGKALETVRDELCSAGERLQAELDDALQHRNAELSAEE